MFSLLLISFIEREEYKKGEYQKFVPVNAKASSRLYLKCPFKGTINEKIQISQ